MVKKKTILLAAILTIAGLNAQDKKAIKYAKTITPEDLKAHLEVIASDAFEGRETGEKGQKMAAKYIADEFEQLGLEAPVDGSYFQSFDLLELSTAKSYMRRGEDRKEGSEDFIYYSNSETMGEEYIKVILADGDELGKAAYKNKYVAFQVSRYGGLQSKIDEARKAGAKGVVVLLESDDEFGSMKNRFTLPGRMTLGLQRDNAGSKLIIVDKTMAQWLFEKPYDELEVGDESTVVFNADYLDKPIGTENVLGFLRGSEKPEEVIVITAHYDHVGMNEGEIYNGADDDGSGTSAVLELAEAFVNAANRQDGPKRSILFMTVTGEEKGLFGSRYYTDISPVFPLENTVANLNIDMVGRVDDKHSENPEYIYLIGSDKLSQDLHDLSEQVNDTYTKLELDYTYNDENDPNRFYYRSDHYNFAKNNIPIIFYFNGTHTDYHQPTDTVDKINFEKMTKITQLIFFTAWEIANREEKLRLN